MAGLSAQIYTADGWPVAEAVLTLTDLTGQQTARAVADESGNVHTEPLSAGVYTAVVTAPGFQPVAQVARVSADGAGRLGRVALHPEADAIESPPPGPWTIDPVHSTVVATAKHLGIASIKARFSEVHGQLVIAEDISRSTGYAEIKAASIDTGIGMRDDHLRSAEFLDTERFPSITFTGNGFVRTGTNTWSMPGELALHGKSRPVELAVTYGGYGSDPWGGVRAAFHAEAVLHRGDFDINYNALVRAGVAAIGTSVQIDLDIETVQGEKLPQM